MYQIVPLYVFRTKIYHRSVPCSRPSSLESKKKESVEDALVLAEVDAVVRGVRLASVVLLRLVGGGMASGGLAADRGGHEQVGCRRRPIPRHHRRSGPCRCRCHREGHASAPDHRPRKSPPPPRRQGFARRRSWQQREERRGEVGDGRGGRRTVRDDHGIRGSDGRRWSQSSAREQPLTPESRYFTTSCGCTPSLHATLSLKNMKLFIDVGYMVCCAPRKFHLKI
jgi:hypothetical protein